MAPSIMVMRSTAVASPLAEIATYAGADNSGGSINLVGVAYQVGDILIASSGGGGTTSYGVGKVNSLGTLFTSLQSNVLGFSGGNLTTSYWVATQTAASDTITFTGSGGTFSGWAAVTVIRNPSGTPLSAASASGAPPSITAPTLTAPANGGLLLCAFWWSSNGGAGGGTTTLPAGLTSRSSKHTNSSFIVNFDWATKVVAAGATGNQVATASGAINNPIGHSVLVAAQ